MNEQVADFGAKLALAFDLLNLSRSSVAVAVQVDKSVISRWVRGQVRPSDHNLSQLTGLIAVRTPGFNRRDWNEPIERFAERLSGGQAEREPEPMAPPASATAGVVSEWLPKAAEQSRNEIARDGDRYPGLYLQVRHRFANSLPFADLVPIWREGDQLKVRFDGPFWAHTGRIFILGHQLFMIAEDRAVSEGLWFQIMNGVSEGRAVAMDGILTSVPHDRERAPGSTLTVMLRIGDLDDPNVEPPAELLAGYQNRIAALVDAGRVSELAGPEIIDHIINRTHTMRQDGRSDHILRAPASRGMTVSSAERHPVIEGAIRRWRAALGDDRATPRLRLV